MLERRAFVRLTVLGVIAAPLAAEAQAGKVYRIGWLSGTPPTTPESSRNWEAFLQGLREHGWVEGQNIVFERRYSEGKPERFPDLAAELVSLKVDLIVAVSFLPTLAAKNATRTNPIVMVAVADPIGGGLITSLARPGGNITGLTLFAGLETLGKHLELVKEAVPNASRVAVLFDPANQHHVLRLKALEVAARSLRVQLQPLGARGPEEFDSAFAAMRRERAGALVVFAELVFTQHRTRFADLAAKSRLPAVYELRAFAEAGGLMAYGPNLPDMLRRTAYFVDRILKGAKPADLPVEQPIKFELVINMKTAKALGLTIPQTLLLRADELIQ